MKEINRYLVADVFKHLCMGYVKQSSQPAYIKRKKQIEEKQGYQKILEKLNQLELKMNLQKSNLDPQKIEEVIMPIP